MSSRRHLEWLLEQAAQNARLYIDMWERLKTLDLESEEHATLEGELLAQLAQIQFDASDARKEHDRWLDSLPDDEEVEV